MNKANQVFFESLKAKHPKLADFFEKAFIEIGGEPEDFLTMAIAPLREEMTKAIHEKLVDSANSAAQIIVKSLSAGQPTEPCISVQDFLTNLMHLYRLTGLDFDETLDVARRNFNGEVNYFEPKQKIIRVFVLCQNQSGEPDIFMTSITCTEKEYDVGYHYEVAIREAESKGYTNAENGAFDEFDPAGAKLALIK